MKVVRKSGLFHCPLNKIEAGTVFEFNGDISMKINLKRIPFLAQELDKHSNTCCCVDLESGNCFYMDGQQEVNLIMGVFTEE